MLDAGRWKMEDGSRKMANHQTVSNKVKLFLATSNNIKPPQTLNDER